MGYISLEEVIGGVKSPATAPKQPEPPAPKESKPGWISFDDVMKGLPPAQTPTPKIVNALGISMGDWDTYKNELKKIESGGRYNIMGGSSGKYAGAYQMGPAAIKDAARILGEKPPSQEEFLADKDMQERYLEAYTVANNQYLSSNEKYNALPPQEKMQVLAYAHNQGHGGAKNWLNTGEVGADAFGTKGTVYADAISSALGAAGAVGDYAVPDTTPDPTAPDEFQRAGLLPFGINPNTGERSLAVPEVVASIPRLIKTAMDNPTSKEGSLALMELASIFNPATVGTLGTRAAAGMTGNRLVEEAAGRRGVELPAAVTGKPVTQEVAKRAGDIPGVGTPLREASKRAVDQLGAAADDVQRSLGAGEVEAAGTAARKEITKYIKETSKSKVDDVYGKVEALVDPKTRVRLQNTRNVAALIKRERRSAEMNRPSKALSVVADAMRAEGLTYKGVSRLRTAIGEMMQSGNLPAGISQGELKLIYGSLTDDLAATVSAAGGPKALKAWQRANNFNKHISNRREQLDEILGASTDTGLVDRVLATASTGTRGDLKKLRAVKKVLGNDTWDEIASTVIAKLGRDPDGNFSPSRFLAKSGWNRLDKKAKEVLFRKDQLEALEDIATISRKFKQLDEFRNNSQTAGTVITGLAAAGAASLIDWGTTLASLAGSRAVAQYLSYPRGSVRISKWLKAADKAMGTPADGLASRQFEILTRSLALDMAKEFGLDEQETIKKFEGTFGLKPGYTMLGA